MAADERGDGSEAGNCLVMRAAGRLAWTGQCRRGWHATDMRAVRLCARTWLCVPVPVHATQGVRAASRRRHTCGSYSDPFSLGERRLQEVEWISFFRQFREALLIRHNVYRDGQKFCRMA